MSTDDTTALPACHYCHGIGACPRCWGRTALEEMARTHAAEIERARSEARAAALAEAVRAVETYADQWETQGGRGEIVIRIAADRVRALPASPSAAPVEPAPLPMCACGRDRVMGTATMKCPACWPSWLVEIADEMEASAAPVEPAPSDYQRGVREAAAVLRRQIAQHRRETGHDGSGWCEDFGCGFLIEIVNTMEALAGPVTTGGPVQRATVDMSTPLPPPSSEAGAFDVWQARQAFGAAVIAWQDAHRDCAGSLLYEHGRLVCHGCGATREQSPPPPSSPTPAAPAGPEPAPSIILPRCDWPKSNFFAGREGRVCRRGLHMVRGVAGGSWDVTEPCPEWGEEPEPATVAPYHFSPFIDSPLIDPANGTKDAAEAWLWATQEIARAEEEAAHRPDGLCSWPRVAAAVANAKAILASAAWRGRFCVGTEHHEWTGTQWVVSTCPARGREGGGR